MISSISDYLVSENSRREECDAQIRGYKGAKYKKFSDAAAAEEFVATNASTSLAISEIPGDNTAANATTANALVKKGKKRVRSPDIDDEGGWDVVYCDGACKGNGRAGSVAGIGVWWGRNDPR